MFTRSERTGRSRARNSSSTARRPVEVPRAPARCRARAVALSCDGNTALVGAPDDNNELGATWVFTRTNSNWSQQAEINPTDRTLSGGLQDAAHVGRGGGALADGNTALIGGPKTTATSARPGSTPARAPLDRGPDVRPWRRSRSVRAPLLRLAVALSADGTTALIGGPENGNPRPVPPGSSPRPVPARIPDQQQPSSTARAHRQRPRFGGSVSLSSTGTPPCRRRRMTAIPPARRGSSPAREPPGTRRARSHRTGRESDGRVRQGVALAADGQTAMIGGPNGQQPVSARRWPSLRPIRSAPASRRRPRPRAAARSLCRFRARCPPARIRLLDPRGTEQREPQRLQRGTGQLTYTSHAFFSGQDSFTYRVSDQWGISNIATATLTCRSCRSRRAPTSRPRASRADQGDRDAQVHGPEGSPVHATGS